MAANFWKSSHFNHWLFDEIELQMERSKGEHNNDTNYHKILVFYTTFIQAIGEQLKMRQQVIATATIYLKRFYVRNNFYSLDPLLLSPIVVHVASKVEECGLATYPKLIGVCQFLCKQQFHKIFRKPYSYQRSSMVRAEYHLLEELDCSLVVFNPYRNLVLYCESITSDSDLLQLAWRVINDTLRTDVPLLYPPHLIALACLHYAAIIQERDVESWFSDLNVDIKKIIEITRYINKFHEFYTTYDETRDIPVLVEKFIDYSKKV